MKMAELREKARQIGIKPRKLKKKDLIHAIQQAEGNPDCYGTAEDYCDQENCSYRDNCIKEQSL